jgi:epsilon-lactone hydrolase
MTQSLITQHHPLLPGDLDGQKAVFARNTALSARHGDDRRGYYAAMSALTPMAAGVAREQVNERDARGWWLSPAAPLPGRALLFVHGGGYHLGDAQTYCGFASQFAALTRCAVFAVDYPLAPEQRFPAAYEHVLRARAWLAARGHRQIALLGDSAGGGLVLATLGEPLNGSVVSSVVAFSPWTDLAVAGTSFSDPATVDPIFKPELLAGLARSYLGGADPRDRRASPLYHLPDALPAIALQVGSDEILLDDARRYAWAAAKKGGEVRLDIYDGLYHVFQRDIGAIEAARQAIDSAGAFINGHWLEGA